jgi:hypothetical protein
MISRWRFEPSQPEERMITVIDQIFDRNYQHGRADLNAALVGALKHVGNVLDEAFAALNRIEYSAPWAVPGRKARMN